MLIIDKLTEDERNQIKIMYIDNKLSALEIGRRFNLNYNIIIRFLKKEGITLKTRKECVTKHQVNHNFFETIDTEEKSYFLGLFYADGYNQEDSHNVRMNLHSRDKHILETLTSLTQPTKRLYYAKKKDQYAICIVSEKMSKDLANHGCFQRKTEFLKPPETVPDSLIHHFIRGYFDGDGCVCVYHKKGKPNSFVCSVRMFGTEDFISWTQSILAKKCDLPINKLSTKTNFITLYGLHYSSKKRCLRICEYLYNNATIYLTRKYDKFMVIEKHKDYPKNRKSRKYNLNY